MEIDLEGDSGTAVAPVAAMMSAERGAEQEPNALPVIIHLDQEESDSGVGEREQARGRKRCVSLPEAASLPASSSSVEVSPARQGGAAARAVVAAAPAIRAAAVRQDAVTDETGSAGEGRWSGCCFTRMLNESA